jgi:hypothetical protein
MADDSAEEHGDAKKLKDEQSSHSDETGDETGDEEEEPDSEDDEEDEDDDEPKLKYARLTGQLAPVYRNGDATSTFLVAGDKMVCPQLDQRRSITELF